MAVNPYLMSAEISYEWLYSHSSDVNLTTPISKTEKEKEKKYLRETDKHKTAETNHSLT